MKLHLIFFAAFFINISLCAQYASVGDGLDFLANTYPDLSDNKNYIKEESIRINKWPETCFDGIDSYYKIDTNGDILISFYSSYTGESNNQIFSQIGDLKIFFELNFIDQSVNFVTSKQISDYIDPYSSSPYVFRIPWNQSSPLSFISVGLINSPPCESYGPEVCRSLSRSNLVLPSQYQEINFYTIDYCPRSPNYYLACDLKNNLIGTKQGQDLIVNSQNISTNELLSIVGQLNINDIQLIITGYTGQNGNSQTVEFFNQAWSNFEVENWEETLPNLGIFDDYVVQVIATKTSGEQISCPELGILTLVNDSQLCDIFTVLNYTYDSDNSTLDFNYLSATNPTYLADAMASVGLKLNEAESLLDSNVNNITFTLSYSNGGPYTQESFQITNVSAINLKDIAASFNNIDALDFTGSLTITYQDFSGIYHDCLLSPIDLSGQNPENDLPVYNCGDSYTLPDIINETDITNLHIGDVISSAGFVVKITEVTGSGNLYSGNGLVNLPFTDEPLKVFFGGIKVNTDGDVYYGSIHGEEASPEDFPDFTLNPDTLNFGGDICLPPTLDEDYNDNGFDPVTGLDANGFSQDSIHSETGTIYDVNGFDISGVNEATGELWNEDNCSREGELYAENAEGEMVNTGQPCDPTNSGDPAVTEFLDSITTVFPEMVSTIVEDYISGLTDSLNNLDCSSIRVAMNVILTDLEASNQIDRKYITGDNDEYINDGMSEFFASPPKPSVLRTDDRNPQVVALENKHIDLFSCDRTKIIFQQFKDAMAETTQDKLLDYLNPLLQNLTKTQVEKFKENPDLFNDWIILQLSNYVDGQLGIGYIIPTNIDPFKTNFDVNENANRHQSPFHSTASLDGGGIDSYTNLEEENYWLFDQGFSEINGVNRVYYLEELYNQQKMLGGDGSEEGGILPIKLSKYIDASFYDIYLSKLKLTPQGATLDAYFLFIDPNSGKKIVMHAQNISFGIGGLTGTAKLSLDTAIEIRLSNAALLRIKPGDQTYVAWDCNGFTGIGIGGQIELCENIVVPIDSSTLEVIPNERYTIDFNLEMDSWSDFYFSLNENTTKPFAMANNDKYVFTVKDFVVDFSDTQSPAATALPDEYISPHFSNNKFEKSWKGFYMGELSVTLPNDFESGEDQSMSIGVQDVVIDGNGVSAFLFAENVVSIEDGNAGGWPISVDEFNLLILRNNIKGGGLGGDIKIPIMKDGMHYTASVYSGNNIDFTLSPNAINEIDMFLAEVVIDSNSIIEVGYVDDEFKVVATLNGILNVGSDDVDLPIDIPDITFTNFRIANEEPHFDPGSWKFENNVSASIAGFNINVKNIKPISAQIGEAGLSFDMDLSLVEALKINAGGSFEIIGTLEEDTYGRQDWSFDRVKVNALAVDVSFSAGHISGEIIRFEKHPIYGQGFQGKINMEFKSLGKVEALALFGNTSHNANSSYKYFFVDAQAELNGLGIPAGPLVISGFAGGVSYHMQKDYGNINPGNTPPTSLIIGQSLSGTQYLPDEGTGLGFKAGVLLKLATSETVFNGSAALEMVFNSESSGGGLQYLGFEGMAKFMSRGEVAFVNGVEQDTSVVPDIDASLKAYLFLGFNFNKNEFHGKFVVFLATPGDIITGSGTNNKMVDAEVYFGPEKWYIYMGTPSDRCGIKITIPFLNASLNFTSYLDVGTEIPDMPSLPSTVREIAYKVKPNQTFRESGAGFVFGAAFEFHADLDFGIASAELDAGLGFDLMVRDFGDSYCQGDNPTETVGIDGWYAMGQIWAYLEGKLKLLGYNVLEAGFAAALQAQLPNPFYAQATIGFKIHTLLGDIGKSVKVSFGDHCYIISDDPDNIGLEIISMVNPIENTEEVPTDMRPVILFNAPVNSKFEIEDFNGSLVSYDIVLKDVELSGSYGSLGNRVEFNEDKTVATVIPYDLFYEGDSIEMTVYVDIFKNGSLLKTETRYTKFYIGEGYDVIPDNNVKYAYPVDGMFNFYKEEYTAEEGYIQLNGGMPELLLNPPEDMDLKVRLSRNNGTKYIYDCDYDVLTGRLSFPLLPAHLDTNMAYKIEVAFLKRGTYSEFTQGNGLDFSEESGGTNSTGFFQSSQPSTPGGNAPSANIEDVLYTSYFRVSEYNTIAQKIQLISNDPSNGTLKQAEIELFDKIDLELISLKLNESSWYKNNYKNKLYSLSFPYYILGEEDCLMDFKVTLPETMGQIGEKQTIVINENRYQHGWNTAPLNGPRVLQDPPETQAFISYAQEAGIKSLYDGVRTGINTCFSIINDPYYNGEVVDDLTDEYLSDPGKFNPVLYNIYKTGFKKMTPGIYTVKLKYTLPGGLHVRSINVNFNK